MKRALYFLHHHDRIKPTSTATLALLCGLPIAAGSALAAGEHQVSGNDRPRPVATGLIYGGAIGVNREIYSDYDRRVVPLPLIGYRGEKLQVLGPFVSYEFFRAGPLGLEARLSPRFQGFDESDSDVFRGMDERKSSFDYGLGFTYERDNWKLDLVNLHDLLDRSNGSEARLDLSRRFSIGNLIVEPAVGTSYLDRRLVDYYYGVDTSEVTSFRPAYDGDSALNARLGVTVSTPAFFGGFTRLGVEHTWFDGALADSPLTDTDTNLRFFISFSKSLDR